MAENRNINTGGGGNTFLAFVLGAVVLAIGVVGYFMLADDTATEVETPPASAPATPGTGAGNAPSAPSGGDSGPATGGGTSQPPAGGGTQ